MYALQTDLSISDNNIYYNVDPLDVHAHWTSTILYTTFHSHKLYKLLDSGHAVIASDESVYEINWIHFIRSQSFQCCRRLSCVQCQAQHLWLHQVKL